jgi:hypothetical protein
VTPRSVPPLDRQFWLAILVAALVVVPRTALIGRAHSHCWDDQFHLSCGLSFLLRTDPKFHRNDPPLGPGILALPFIVTGSIPESPESYWARPHDPSSTAAPPFFAVLFGHRLAPETLSLLVALWKAMLFVPFTGLVFHWCRGLYGLRSGWLGLTLVLLEPTLAGHIAPAALDVLAVEAILFACYFAWRYFEQPTRRRLIYSGGAIAAALLTKHTAVLLPLIALAYGIGWRFLRRPPEMPRRKASRVLLNELLAIGLVVVVSIWPLTLFDFSPPNRYGPLIRTQYTEKFSFGADVVNTALERRWPAGIYIGSIRAAQQYTTRGHRGYLLGEKRDFGWWWYFPVVATYKVPLPIVAMFILAALSLSRVRPKWGELALLIPAVSYALFLCSQNIDIGFRHFLPAYVPMLILVTRGMGTSEPSLRRPLTAGYCLLAGLLILDAARFHPDYLSYTNFPRKNVHLQISDSNLDWGQSLKQVRECIDSNAALIRGRPVYLAYFGDPDGDPVGHFLGQRVVPLAADDPALPSTGILIASPVHVADVYDHYPSLAPIRQAELEGRLTPLTIIGHSMRVYDLDRR